VLQELLKKAQSLSKGLHNSKQQLHSTVNPTPSQKYTRHAKEELVCVALENPRNWKLTTCRIFHLQMTDITSSSTWRQHMVSWPATIP
jgi:hypothetical protein